MTITDLQYVDKYPELDDEIKDCVQNHRWDPDIPKEKLEKDYARWRELRSNKWNWNWRPVWAAEYH